MRAIDAIASKGRSLVGVSSTSSNASEVGPLPADRPNEPRGEFPMRASVPDIGDTGALVKFEDTTDEQECSSIEPVSAAARAVVDAADSRALEVRSDGEGASAEGTDSSLRTPLERRAELSAASLRGSLRRTHSVAQ